MTQDSVQHLHMKMESPGPVSARLDAVEIFHRVEALLPEIEARSQEFEDARRIVPDMVEKLRDAGCFRICLPSMFGGAEFGMDGRLHLLSILAQADASVGWTIAIGNNGALILMRARRETVEEIYLNGPDTVLAGTAGPQGTAEKVDGGYRVSGRWSWASGSLHAEWLTANCIVTQGGRPVRPPMQNDGPPMMRMAIVPRDRAELLDTWHVAGLCATGSNDFVIDDLFVPDSHMLDFFGGDLCTDAPIYRSYPVQAGFHMAALAIGIARGALADILVLTRSGKRRMFTADDMSKSEILQLRLGTAMTALEALTTALHGKAREYVARAVELPSGPEQLRNPLVLTCCAMATWIVAQAGEIVEMAYDAGGGSSVWRSATLQRRLRDMKTLTTHIQNSEASLINAGKGLIDGVIDPSAVSRRSTDQ